MTTTGPAPRHRAAVIGSPVAHSLSPVLHRAAYADLGLEGWEYALRDVAPDALMPPQLVGLCCAILGMIIGSLAPIVIGGQGHPEIVDLARQPEIADNPPA